MSSATYDMKSHNAKMPGVGVNAWGIPKENYDPKLHNPTTYSRAGSSDALACKSLNMAGERVDYWGSK